LYPIFSAILKALFCEQASDSRIRPAIEIVIASSMLAERQASYTNPKKQDNRAEACNSTANAAR
jgi:hypothetical protein